MIRTVRGRHRSERTEDEELRIFEEELDALEPDEAEALLHMLEEMRTGRGMNVVQEHRLHDGTVVRDEGRPFFDLIQEVEYSKPIVPVDEWVKDSHFMGNVAFTWPKWRQDLKDLFEGGYHEAVVTGAIGTGKSTFVSMVLARMIYEFSCLRNPQRTFGLMPGGKIYIVVLNVSVDLAKAVIFEKLRAELELSPYFTEEFVFEPTQAVLRFPNGLRVIPRATSDQSTLGLDVIGGVFSEVNFESGGHLTKAAANAANASRAMHGITTNVGHVYSELVTRRKSRFGRAAGKIPGLYLIDSSKRDQSDFTEAHIEAVQEDPFVFVRDYAIWDTQPANRFAREKFRVLVGDEKIPSKILEPNENPVLDPNSKQQIIEVPENWRPEFVRNLDAAIRNVAGIATASIDRLFTSMTPIRNAMDAWRERYVSPFMSDVHMADRKLNVRWDLISDQVDGAWRLKVDPRAEHAVHIDIGLTRCRYGQAMGYIVGEKLVGRAVAGEMVQEKAPIIAIRWCLALEAPPEGEIQIGLGRALVWNAMGYGHRVTWGSCDQYQSVEMLQKMEARGIKTETVSVEGEEPYLAFREAANEDRLLLPDSPLLYKELKELLYDKARGKVDHPPGPDKTKDLADAVCGVIWRLTLLYLDDQVHPATSTAVQGVSEVYRDEDAEEQFWVLGPNAARPVEPEDRPGARTLQGVGGVTPSEQQKRQRPYLLK